LNALGSEKPELIKYLAEFFVLYNYKYRQNQSTITSRRLNQQLNAPEAEKPELIKYPAEFFVLYNYKYRQN
jgi:hypothetical protein